MFNWQRGGKQGKLSVIKVCTCRYGNKIGGYDRTFAMFDWQGRGKQGKLYVAKVCVCRYDNWVRGYCVHLLVIVLANTTTLLSVQAIEQSHTDP